jgi:hypothetical protein
MYGNCGKKRCKSYKNRLCWNCAERAGMPEKEFIEDCDTNKYHDILITNKLEKNF